MSLVQSTDIPGGVPSLPAGDHRIMVQLVDDQAIVGEAIRRALAKEDHIDFHLRSGADPALATMPLIVLSSCDDAEIKRDTFAGGSGAAPATRYKHGRKPTCAPSPAWKN